MKIVGHVYGLGDIRLSVSGAHGETDTLDMDNGEGCSFNLAVGQLEALLAIAKAEGLERTDDATWPYNSGPWPADLDLGTVEQVDQ